MQTTRTDNTPNQSIHTTESILEYLDSDRSDTQLKSFINTLLQSPETERLLYQVASIWKQRITQKQTSMLKLEKHISDKKNTLRNCYEFNFKKNIAEKENAIKTAEEQLTKMRLAFSTNLNHTIKLLSFIDPSLNEFIETDDSRNNESNHSTKAFNR